jgi:hypothetical protein
MRRHPFDPISFVLGALFGAVGLTFLFGDADLGDLHVAVLWPVPLILVGMLMLISTIQRRTRHQPEHEVDTMDEEHPTGAEHAAELDA